MEIRKLQSTGGSSYTVTVPKAWVESTDLVHKKSIVITQQQSGILMLQPEHLHQTKSTYTIRAAEMDTTKLQRELIACYLSGTDDVHITSEKPVSLLRTKIRQALRSLIGFEIVSETARDIHIKNIFDPAKFPISETVEKMFLMSRDMFGDAMNGYEKQNKELMIDVIDRDIEIDRLYFAVIRQFRSLISGKMHEEEINVSLVEMDYYRTVATNIERIADHAVKIASSYILYPIQVAQSSTAFFQLTKKLLEYLDTSCKMIQVHDVSIAHTILDADKELETLVQTYRSESKTSHPLTIIFIDSIDRLRGYLMNIAEETINVAIEYNA